jgi:hypothetical protein
MIEWHQELKLFETPAEEPTWCSFQFHAFDRMAHLLPIDPSLPSTSSRQLIADRGRDQRR